MPKKNGASAGSEGSRKGGPPQAGLCDTLGAFGPGTHQGREDTDGQESCTTGKCPGAFPRDRSIISVLQECLFRSRSNRTPHLACHHSRPGRSFGGND